MCDHHTFGNLVRAMGELDEVNRLMRCSLDEADFFVSECDKLLASGEVEAMRGEGAEAAETMERIKAVHARALRELRVIEEMAAKGDALVERIRRMRQEIDGEKDGEESA